MQEGAAELERWWAGGRALGRDPAHVRGRGRRPLCADRSSRSTRSPGLSERLWQLLTNGDDYVARSALTGGQAVQMVPARALLCDSISRAGRWPRTRTSPDRRTPTRASIRPTAFPRSRRLNNALLRADQIDWAEGKNGTHRPAPTRRDAEACFGGALNSFELRKAMIEGGVPPACTEDQLAAKKCGHLGGKVLVPTSRSSSAR